MNVTERDLSIMSRKMPPDKWRFILRECLDISEADISRAEYSCKGEAVQAVIFKALHTWKDGQDSPLTRQDMYAKLEQARQLGICQKTDWYLFLLPEGLQLDVVQPAPQIQIGIFPGEGLLSWILNNPLQVNFFISAMIIQIYFTSTSLWNMECETNRKRYENGLEMWSLVIVVSYTLQLGFDLHVREVPISLNIYFDHSRIVGLLSSALNICALTFLGNIEYCWVLMGVSLCINNFAAYRDTTNGRRFNFTLNLITSSMVGALIAHVILYLCQIMHWKSFPFSVLIICEFLNFLTWLMSGAHFTNFVHDCMLHRDMARQGLIDMWDNMLSNSLTVILLVPGFLCATIYQILQLIDDGMANINFLPLITGDCITLIMLCVHKLLRLISFKNDKPFHEKITLTVLLALNSCILTLVNGHHSRIDFIYHFPLLLLYPTQPFHICALL